MEITVTQLSEQTGINVNHLSQLIFRGILPKGRREGNTRILPAEECLSVIRNHEPGAPWRKRQSRATVEPMLTWGDVL